MQSALAILSLPVAVIDTPPLVTDQPVDSLGASFAKAVLAADPDARASDRSPADPVPPNIWLGPVPALTLCSVVPSNVEKSVELSAATVSALSSDPNTKAVVPDPLTPDGSGLLAPMPVPMSLPMSVPVPAPVPVPAATAADLDTAAVDGAAAFAMASGRDEAATRSDPVIPTLSDGEVTTGSRAVPDLSVPEIPFHGPDMPVKPLVAGAVLPVTTIPPQDLNGAQASASGTAVAGDTPQVRAPTLKAGAARPPLADTMPVPARMKDPKALHPVTSPAAPSPQDLPPIPDLGSQPSGPIEARPQPALDEQEDRAIPDATDPPLPEEPAAAAVQATSDTVPRPKPSFWERVFVDLANPAVPLAAPDQATPFPVSSPTLRAASKAELSPPGLPPPGHLSGPVTPLPAFAQNRQDARPSKDPETLVPHPIRTTELPAAVLPTFPALFASPAQIVLSGWDEEASAQDDISLSGLPVMAQTAGATPTAAPQAHAPLPVPHVAAQIAGVLVNRVDDATELALAPEELGRVKLRLKPDSGNPDRMVILISVERPETLDLFRRHAGELAEAIRAAGYSGADIGFGQQGQGQEPPHQHPSGGFEPRTQGDDPAAPPSTPRHRPGASLDLRL